MGAPYRSGGKTGTAQAVGLRQNEKYNATKLDEYKRDHSLYEAFAPIENPTVALAVIVENSGFGAEAAAPIARRVLDYLLAGQYPSEADIDAVRVGKASAPIGQPRRVVDMPLPFAREALVDVPLMQPPAPTPAPVASGVVSSAPSAPTAAASATVAVVPLRP